MANGIGVGINVNKIICDRDVRVQQVTWHC